MPMFPDIPSRISGTRPGYIVVRNSSASSIPNGDAVKWDTSVGDGKSVILQTSGSQRHLCVGSIQNNRTWNQSANNGRGVTVHGIAPGEYGLCQVWGYCVVSKSTAGAWAGALNSSIVVPAPSGSNGRFHIENKTLPAGNFDRGVMVGVPLEEPGGGATTAAVFLRRLGLTE